ncbi:MAG: phosphatidate cytidylyltransferase, partial [Hellea sp.]
MKKNTNTKPVWKNIGIRGITALVLAGIVFLPIYFGGLYWAILVSIFSARMIWEWVRMSNSNPELKGCFIPIMGVVLSCLFMAFESYNFVIISVLLSTLLIGLERFNRNQILWACFGFLYVCLPSIALIGLRGSEVGFFSEGFIKICYIILIVVGADVGAYLGGSYFKGPKMSPVISPNKTWSGFISGLSLGIVMGGVTGYFANMDLLFSLTFAIPVVLFSIVGDLFESGVKRIQKVKDTGELLPGHGGLLDRLDSLMFAVLGSVIILYFAPD